MGAGERRRAGGIVIREGVERVFDDVVPGGADDMEKELAREGGQAEPGADGAAVEHDGAEAGRRRLAPFGEDPPLGIEEDEGERDLARAVAAPVIRRDEPGMQPTRIAKESEVRREIERVEIGTSIGQQLVRQAQRIEAGDLGSGGDQMPDLRGKAVRIEGRDEDAIRLGRRELGDRLRRVSENWAADRRHILDKDAGERQAAQIMEGIEARGKAERIIDCDAPYAGKAIDELRRQPRRHRVAHRLIEAVSAASIAEGFDIELHGPAVWRESSGDEISGRPQTLVRALLFGPARSPGPQIPHFACGCEHARPSRPPQTISGGRMPPRPDRPMRSAPAGSMDARRFELVLADRSEGELAARGQRELGAVRGVDRVGLGAVHGHALHISDALNAEEREFLGRNVPKILHRVHDRVLPQRPRGHLLGLSPLP